MNGRKPVYCREDFVERPREHRCSPRMTFLRRGQIAHYKIPRHVKFVDSFPTTVTGKVQKFVMRKVMAEELGLSEQKTA